MTLIQEIPSSNLRRKWETCPDCGCLVKKIGSVLSLSGHKNDCSLQGQDPSTFSVDNKTGRTPFPYQQKGIEFVHSLSTSDDRPLGFGLFWQMRLGKTLTVIKIAKRKDWKKILVICPKSVIPTWIKELKYEEVDGIPLICKDAKSLVEFIHQIPKGWFVTNYETMLRVPLHEVEDWDLVILDESHKIKDPGTKISQLIANKNSFPDAARAALTGTPAPENILNYFQTIKFLKGEFCGIDSWWGFRNRFFYNNGNGQYLPYIQMKEVLAAFMSDFCSVLQREHAGIGGKTLYEQRFVELEGDYKNYYDELEKNWCNKDYEATWAIQVFQQLHQLSGGYPKIKDHDNPPETSDHKIKELKSILREDLSGEKVVIWARYRREIQEIRKAISRYGTTAVIHGDTDMYTRQRYMDSLNNKSSQSLKYLVCQIKTGSLGVDLSGADTAIVFSNELGVASRLQMVDRLIHPDKKTPNLIIDITAKDTIDEDIYDLLQMKLENQQEMLMRIFRKAKERHV